MAKLRDIVLQLNEEEYQAICKRFQQTSATKYYTLFVKYREKSLKDGQIRDLLKINDTAYYTLKSRLLDRIQEYLSAQFSKHETDVMAKVEDIPELVYATQKSKAIAILQQLETDVQQHDNPYKLASIYNALKKLNVNTPKYYHYTQLYNRHLAYTIAMDKAEDLLLEYARKVGEYNHHRDETIIQVLSLIRMELHNVTKLYESHHLKVYEWIVDAMDALFISGLEKEGCKEKLDQALHAMKKTFDQYISDKSYHYLKLVFEFLNFEKMHLMGREKEAAVHFEAVNEKLNWFLLYNHCTWPGKFLESKMERYIQLGITHRLYEENSRLLKDYEPDKNDAVNYIHYMIYRAASAYYAGGYAEAAGVMVRLMNEVSFRNFQNAELETKTFITLCYLLQGDDQLSRTHLRSVSRKLIELRDPRYEHLKDLLKALSAVSNQSTRLSLDKVKMAFQIFSNRNVGEGRLLRFISLDDTLARALVNVKFR